MIQDIEPKHLYNEWKKNAVPKKSSAVVQFRGQDLLCRIDDNGLKFPSRAQFTEPDEAFTYLFELDGREYYLLFDENERALDGYSYRNIGLFRTEKPKELAYAAVSAWHLCSWYRDARYCGRCGEKLVHDGNERMMRCPDCGMMEFPKICPAVIIAVTHGDKILMSKYAGREYKKYALLAGLVLGAVTAVVINIRYVAISAFIAILYAATDELHQLFVPGRSGRVTYAH